MGIRVCESLMMVEDLLIILILQDRKIIKNVISFGQSRYCTWLQSIYGVKAPMRPLKRRKNAMLEGSILFIFFLKTCFI